jgi:hypothetical protein
MGRDRSKKSKFKSRYSDGYVTAAQYITEFICEKVAQKRKKELPMQFWKQKEWEKTFKAQVFSANKLLKKYDATAIIAALKSSEARNTISLRAPWLEGIIESEQRKIDLQREQQVEEVKKVEDVNQIRPLRTKSTKLGDLRDLDL